MSLVIAVFVPLNTPSHSTAWLHSLIHTEEWMLVLSFTLCHDSQTVTSHKISRRHGE